MKFIASTRQEMSRGLPPMARRSRSLLRTVGIAGDLGVQQRWVAAGKVDIVGRPQHGQDGPQTGGGLCFMDMPRAAGTSMSWTPREAD